MDQTREIEDLKKTVALTQRTLTEHIGGGGKKAHYRGNLYSPGFMYPEDVEILNKALGNLSRVEVGTDVLTLPAGVCWGASLKNSPVTDDSIVFYNVQIMDEAHKLITAFHSGTGRRFVLNIHDDNSAAPVGWTFIHRYKTLYNGYIGDEGTKFTLAEPIEKYAYIRVLLDNGSNHQMVHEVRVAADVALTDTHTFNSTGVGFDISEMTLTLSGVNGTIKYNNRMTVINSTVSKGTSTMKLKRIEGVG